MQYILRTAGLPEYAITNDEMSIPFWGSDENFIWRVDIPNSYDTSFINRSFLWTHRIGYPGLTTSTLDELNNTGLFSQLSVELKDAIREYYINTKFRYGSIEVYLLEIRNWQNALLQYGIQNGNPYIYEDPIDLVKSDKVLSGSIRQLIRQAAWMVEGVPELSKDAEDLIKFISKEKM